MSLSFAIVTPSYEPDFERCRLLAESVDRHVAKDVRHYIVVDRRDERLFSSLKSSRVELVRKQDVIPGWLRQFRPMPKYWLSTKGLPIRGWMVQQIVKLSVDAYCPADVFLFVDSDTVFVRPFDPKDTIRGDRVPFFREIMPHDDGVTHNAWHRVGAELLGVTVPERNATNYISQLVTWRRQNVDALHRHIERRAGRGWVESMVHLRTMSEYVLYGMFVDHVLKDASGQYEDPTIVSLNYWDTKTLDDAALAKLKDALRPEQVAVMVSAKSHTDVDAVRRVFFA